MAKDRCDGWSKIADYLGVDPRTAQRYEKDRQLPVKRLPHGGPKSPVFAFKNDLDVWMGANMTRESVNNPQCQFVGSSGDQDLSGPILARISKLSNLTLYRRDYFLRFELSRSRVGVRAQLECHYRVCNATDERAPFVQELTIDDPDRGYVEELVFFTNKAPVYFLRRPAISERCLGFSIYRGQTLLLEPAVLGVVYECRSKWVINRSENDFWNTHMMLPTVGISVETQAPSDFVITPSYFSRDLLMTGEHLDIGWNLRR
jgi:hypothetical protein